MSTHTPGPWKVHSTGLVITFDEVSSIAYPGEDGCQVFENGSETRAKANAHLIAAAPDLLLALKELLFNSLHGNGFDAHYKAQDRAKAAIAKAAGVES